MYKALEKSIVILSLFAFSTQLVFAETTPRKPNHEPPTNTPPQIYHIALTPNDVKKVHKKGSMKRQQAFENFSAPEVERLLNNQKKPAKTFAEVGVISLLIFPGMGVLGIFPTYALVFAAYSADLFLFFGVLGIASFIIGSTVAGIQYLAIPAQPAKTIYNLSKPHFNKTCKAFGKNEAWLPFAKNGIHITPVPISREDVANGKVYLDGVQLDDNAAYLLGVYEHPAVWVFSSQSMCNSGRVSVTTLRK